MSTPGSTNRPGYLYHEPAFPAEGKKVHRSDNQTRLDALMRAQDWWNQQVLDIGCNVGFFSIKLALQGAKVTGVDLDPDAIDFATKQAREYMVEGAFFMQPTQDRRYTKDKDVLLALSVLPWIYATEKNPGACIADLFSIPTAYVEIPYPPDGRANVPGVVDDATAEAYLRAWYPEVTKILSGQDSTEGVLRRRTVWKCTRPSIKPEVVLGAQCEVEIGDEWVTKRRREGKTWSAIKEAEFLELVAPHKISPKVISKTDTDVTMFRVHGWPLSSARVSYVYVRDELSRILAALEAAGIWHNDIRPANLILGKDGKIYLIDYGWATTIGQRRPEGVNPIFGGGTDRDAVAKILDMYPKWMH